MSATHVTVTHKIWNEFRDQAIEEWLLEHKDIAEQRQKLDAVIEELDGNLDRQLKKQEHDYLKGYSIYVKTKEKELKTLI